MFTGERVKSWRGRNRSRKVKLWRYVACRWPSLRSRARRQLAPRPWGLLFVPIVLVHGCASSSGPGGGSHGQGKYEVILAWLAPRRSTASRTGVSGSRTKMESMAGLLFQGCVELRVIGGASRSRSRLPNGKYIGKQARVLASWFWPWDTSPGPEGERHRRGQEEENEADWPLDRGPGEWGTGDSHGGLDPALLNAWSGSVCMHSCLVTYILTGW